MRKLMVAIIVVVVLSSSLTVRGDVFSMSGTRNSDGSWSGLASLEFVHVGNPGNAADTRYGRNGTGQPEDPIGYGAVGYDYRIGKFEITTGQYCEFLNAVAKTDPYGLYNTYMDPRAPSGPYPPASPPVTPNIIREGTPGNYHYRVSTELADGVQVDWNNLPVNLISWSDGIRFCNWLTNGQPTTGNEDLTTTEDGSYFLNGAVTDAAVSAVTRKSPAQGGRYYMPTEDEWYKAAYHKNDGVTGNYWEYPTGTNDIPDNELLTPDPGNNANCYISDPPDDGLTVKLFDDAFPTPVGAFENSESPYGTFDQGGNVEEFNENVTRKERGGLRGGWADFPYIQLSASFRWWGPDCDLVTGEDSSAGFRIIELPKSGDANFDGNVNFSDYLTFSQNFGLAGGWTAGDFTADGTVDFSDFLLLSQSFGGGIGSSDLVSSVPEPTTLSLLTMALLALTPVRRMTKY